MYGYKFLKLLVGTLLVLFILLYIWSHNYLHSCHTLVFPFMVWAVLASSFISLKMQERRCYRSCYLKDSSILSVMLSSRVLVTLVYFVVSVAMTLSVVYGVLGYGSKLWLYLVFQVVVSTALFIFLKHIMKSSINEKFLPILAREFTVNISVVMFFVVYIYLMLQGHEPEYLRDTIEETISVASQSISSECYYVDVVLRAKRELDGSFWWFMSEASVVTSQELTRAVMWIAFVVIDALAIVGVNRLVVQTIYLLDMIFKKVD